jgi:diaminohydroxyphosphoribosylaminopyrimidine deaminase / 5-amino-6-(5-phosphoribosylamino)uracil reductase
VDSRLDTPLDAKLFSTLGKRAVPPEVATKFNLSQDAINSIAGRALYIYAAEQNDAKKLALEALDATVIYMPEALTQNALPAPSAGGPKGAKVDLRAMMLDLGRREINELHVEAGFKLNGSLIKAGVVDELLVYTAPKLLGPGMGMANTPALAALTEALQLDFTSAEMVGEDLRIVARVRGRDRF